MLQGRNMEQAEEHNYGDLNTIWNTQENKPHLKRKTN